MVRLEILPLGHIKVNCYLLLSDGAAIVIDPGFYSSKAVDFLNAYAERERLILLTHSHFDHICGAKQLRDETGVQVAIGRNDVAGLTDTKLSLSDKFHARQQPFSADRTPADGEEFSVGDLHFTAIETSGHTPGGMCYLTGNLLFSGDTLFQGSVGRVDFTGGSPVALMRSLERLMRLDDTVEVYPGHGDATTIGRERRENPFL